MYQSLNFRITGVVPLLMHNGLLANPLHNFSQEIAKISAKRKKTEADFAEMARLEFLGSLYLTNGEPCIPGEMFEAALIGGAKKKRLGETFKAAILCDGMYPLEYVGPRKPLELWENPEFRFVKTVRVKQSRVVRTRPIFNNWAADVEVQFMPDQLDRKQVIEVGEIAGELVGLGDWRPRFGRFSVKVVVAAKQRRAA